MTEVATSAGPANPRVSVAMATFNGEKYLREQLESLAVQTLLPMELVTTDDGSTDRTLEIIEDFARSAPFPVRIYRNSNRLGHDENFLKAANLCVGELIAFCDQDDFWMTDKIEICSSVFDTPDVMLAVHSSRKWYGGDQMGGILHSFRSKKSFKPISLDPVGGLPGFSMMIRKSLLEIRDAKSRPGSIFNLGNQNIQMSHDEWAWFLASIFGTIVLIPEVLARYRRHETNVTRANSGPRILRMIYQSFAVSDYSELSFFLRQCLLVVSERGSSEIGCFQSYLLDGVDYFKKRIEYCERRQLIYTAKRSFKNRLMVFMSLLSSGGYSKSDIGLTLGPRAALKDALVGVTGLAGIFR